MSGIDKSVSEHVKTRDGAIDDPVSRDPQPNSTAERLETNELKFPRSVARLGAQQVSQHSAFTKKEENMSSYLTLIGLLLLVMSPVLVPLLISGTHAMTDLATTRRATTFAQRSGAVAVPD